MKANWIAGGLLLVLYLLWLTATAPARLLAPMLPPGVQVGQFSGSVWRGAAQPVYWHGERLERLAWSLTLAGWQVSLSDPRGVMGQARLWGLRDLRLQEGRLTAPASLLSRWLMSTMPVKAAGEVTFSLTEGRFSDGRCRHIIAGGAQWRQARRQQSSGEDKQQAGGQFGQRIAPRDGRLTAAGATAQPEETEQRDIVPPGDRLAALRAGRSRGAEGYPLVVRGLGQHARQTIDHHIVKAAQRQAEQQQKAIPDKGKVQR